MDTGVPMYPNNIGIDVQRGKLCSIYKVSSSLLPGTCVIEVKHYYTLLQPLEVPIEIALTIYDDLV